MFDRKHKNRKHSSSLNLKESIVNIEYLEFGALVNLCLLCITC